MRAWPAEASPTTSSSRGCWSSRSCVVFHGALPSTLLDGDLRGRPLAGRARPQSDTLVEPLLFLATSGRRKPSSAGLALPPRRAQAGLEAAVLLGLGHVGRGRSSVSRYCENARDARVVVGEALGVGAVLGLALQADAEERVGHRLDAELGQVDRQLLGDDARPSAALSSAVISRGSDADHHVVGVRRLEERALLVGVGVMGVAVDAQLPAGADASCSVSLRHSAPRRNVSGATSLLVPVGAVSPISTGLVSPASAQAAQGRGVEAAVDRRRRRACAWRRTAARRNCGWLGSFQIDQRVTSSPKCLARRRS